MDKETLQFFKDTRPWRVNSGMVETCGGVPIAHMDRDTPNTSPTERDANAKLIVEAVNAFIISKDEPVTYFFLTLKPLPGENVNAQVVVQYEEFGEEQEVPIKSHDYWRGFVSFRKQEANKQGLGISVMCSSSLDFPHDYTADNAVIRLCRDLRAHDVRV